MLGNNYNDILGRGAQSHDFVNFARHSPKKFYINVYANRTQAKKITIFNFVQFSGKGRHVLH